MRPSRGQLRDATQHADRAGGYTRVIRVGARNRDAAEMAILEWTGTAAAAGKTEPAKDEKKTEKPEKK